MGEINLYPFSLLIDMYKKPIEGVELAIQQASYESKGILISSSITNSEESISIYKVSSDGTFVIYDKGRSEGEKVEILKFNTVCNEVDSKFEGLVQQKIQIYQIEQELPVGEYILFQGSSNSSAREPQNKCAE